MSRPTEGAVPGTRPEDDPFRYGWRYVKREQPGGKTEFEQVPLALEDVLHPESGYVIRKDTAHQRDLSYLFGVLNYGARDVRGAAVFSDLIIDWDVPGLRPHSPDLCLVLGLGDPAAPRSRFDVAREGARPMLIVEIVTPVSRQNETVAKVSHYHRAGVPLYVIVDREHIKGPVRLVGYRHAPAGYVDWPPDQDGRLWLEAVDLWLGTRGNRVIAGLGRDGRELEDYSTAAERLAAIGRQKEDKDG
jgi:Uma2 family endonuclease